MVKHEEFECKNELEYVGASFSEGLLGRALGVGSWGSKGL